MHRIALLSCGLLLGCEQSISKTWDSGGKVEAKLTAQACPSVSASPAPPLSAMPECRFLIDQAFTATVEMRMIGTLFPETPSPPRTEIWDIGCDGRCDVAVLYPDHVQDGRIGPGDLSAFSGRVVRHRGKVFEIELNAIGEDQLTVDLDNGLVSYVQTTKVGGRRTGQGSCPVAKR